MPVMCMTERDAGGMKQEPVPSCTARDARPAVVMHRLEEAWKRASEGGTEGGRVGCCITRVLVSVIRLAPSRVARTDSASTRDPASVR